MILLFDFITGCLNLLDKLPETVYRVCDLLTVVTQRNGTEWRNRTLDTVVQEASGCWFLILQVSSTAVVFFFLKESTKN
jgi:E3 ubiquitin-protein ligase HUWE1